MNGGRCTPREWRARATLVSACAAAAMLLGAGCESVTVDARCVEMCEELPRGCQNARVSDHGMGWEGPFRCHCTCDLGFVTETRRVGSTDGGGR